MQKKNTPTITFCVIQRLSKRLQEVVRLLFTSINVRWNRIKKKTATNKRTNKQKYQQNKQKSTNGRALCFSGGRC